MRQHLQTLRLRVRRVIDIGRVGRLAEADQVGDDDAVMRRQPARHAGEIVLVGAETVQQDQRIALAAFEIHVVHAIRSGDFLLHQAGLRALGVDRDFRRLFRLDVEEGHQRDEAKQDQREQKLQQTLEENHLGTQA